jgi:hypothetical protein
MPDPVFAAVSYIIHRGLRLFASTKESQHLLWGVWRAEGLDAHRLDGKPQMRRDKCFVRCPVRCIHLDK